MSTLPLLLSLAEELDNLQSRFYDNDFGLGYPTLGHYHPALSLVPSSTNLLQRIRGSDKSGALSTIGKDGFQVSMDVQHFKPNELTVKTVNNSIVVEGKHNERQDEHGFISRQFTRRYELPPNYDPNQVVSTLSSDGVLTVKVPPPPKSESANERVVQIQHTGPAHLSVKDNPKEDTKEEKKE